MLKFANSHRNPAEIKVGDEVYLKIRPHKQLSMPIRINPKLVARYYAPFKVIAQIGLVAYRLQLPEGAQIQIHPVFHVSQLKRAVGNVQVKLELSPSLQGKGENIVPVQVLQTRELNRHGEKVMQVLIQWKEGGREAATWEDAMIIQEQFPEFQFPEFHLEDKMWILRRGVMLENQFHKSSSLNSSSLNSILRTRRGF